MAKNLELIDTQDDAITLADIRQIIQNCGKGLTAQDFRDLID
jgi:hypothetical protein